MSTLTARIVATESHAAWLEARRSGIGSSDAAAILGESPYYGPLEVYLDKIGEAPPRESTIAMRRGLYLEPLVAALYQEQYPDRHVIQPAIMVHRSREHPYLICTPDRFVADQPNGAPPDRLLELKTTHGWNEKDWDHEAPALHVQIQVQHQLLVTGLRAASVAVLIGDRFLTYDLERNDAFLAAYLPRAAAFWESVQNRTPPATTAASLETVRLLWPTVTARKVIDLPPEALALDLQMAEASAMLKKWKQEEETARASLLLLMGDAQVARLPGGTMELVRNEIPEWTGTVTRRAHVRLNRRAARLRRRRMP
jgi:putative phage-type endonuclease